MPRPCGTLRRLLALLLTALAAACTTATGGQPATLAGEARTERAVSELAEQLDAFWADELERLDAEVPEVLLVDGDVDSACGAAGADEGSFYCGADETVRLQQTDLEEPGTLGDDEGDAWLRFLVAHEYAHHVQAVTGVAEGEADTGPDSDSVRYELQADCLAGAFTAAHPGGLPDAVHLAAVRGVGDDAGDDPLEPAHFEHGSARQRAGAWTRGRSAGVRACLDVSSGR